MPSIDIRGHVGATLGASEQRAEKLPPLPLTDTAIRNARPGEKPIRLFDGGGLYLEVSPAGGKWWRLKYRFNGKE
jgi:Arm DNA-binding domain